MWKGKRALLANVLYRTGAHGQIRKLGNHPILIFNYHRLRAEEPQDYPFDEGVYGPTQSQFKKQMRWFRKNAHIISQDNLLDHIYREKPLPASSMMVTFDDGYKDNFELALPILSEEKVPAVFFIPTKSIEERVLGWWDLIAYSLKRSRSHSIEFRGKTIPLTGRKRSAITDLQTQMRTLRAEESQTFIQEIFHACEVAHPDLETCSDQLMSWDNLRECVSNGISIGSHTHSHRVLSTMSLVDQKFELETSKRILEQRLGITVKSLAYPVGGYRDFNQETKILAQNCGYELGFSFQTGSNHLGKVRPFSVCRIAAEESVPLTCATMTFPSVFAASKEMAAAPE